MSKDNLTKQEFEDLLTKAAQPLKEPSQKSSQEEDKKSEHQNGDDCTGKHTHSNKSEDI